MDKKEAWENFKNTGEINAFLELKQIENTEKGIEEDGEYKIKWNSDSRE